ncbi:hypothetical protein F5Y18DRAFT_425027 [Xylariaceae sp. FL1019]|nr:hypothetical protein F5Y18DRAFT_425027 [Xylariaceae sp. FL1019]
MLPSGRGVSSALSEQIDALDTSERSQFLPVPHPSLWPESGSQSSTVAPRPVPEATTTTRPFPILNSTKSKAQDLRNRVKHVRFEIAQPQVAPKAKQCLPEPALPLSAAVNGPQRSRAVDPVSLPIFEEKYPRWHFFPPPYPTTLETRRSTSSTAEGSLPIPINRYLRQVATCKDWINEQNESRITLRHNSVYQNLVDVRHKFEYLATESYWPETRADAKQWLWQLDQVMAKERKKFSKDELRRIKDIEKGYLAFISIQNDEETGPNQKKQTSMLKSAHRSPLSRVEMLLGKDGSQPCDEWTPYWTHETLSDGAEVAQWDGLETPLSPLKEMSTTKCRRGSFSTAIPEWFFVGEEEGIIVANGVTLDDRWFDFCRQIVVLEELMKAHEDDKKPDKAQDKPVPQWHDPHPGWPTPQRQIAGGIWRCRKGDMATPAENTCRLCPNIPMPEPNPYYAAQFRLERLMLRVARSMSDTDSYKSILRSQALTCQFLGEITNMGPTTRAVAAEPLDEANCVKKPKGNQIWVRGVLVHQD